MPLWFNGQQFPDELMKPAKQKAPMTQNFVCNKETLLPSPPSQPSPPPQASCPQRFSALLARYTLYIATLQDGIESDDDSFAGNEGDESDTNTSDNDCGSGSSDEKVYT